MTGAPGGARRVAYVLSEADGYGRIVVSSCAQCADCGCSVSAEPLDAALGVLSHALWYCELGLRVFPVHTMVGGRCTCGDASCSRPAKHPCPAKWLELATPNPDDARELFRRWPVSNVGIVTGGGGVVVLDVDGASGVASLAELEAKFGPRPIGPVVRTARGWHEHIRAPLDARLGNRVKFRPGLDVRGDGGFVVMPPSVHESGFVYAFEPGASYTERERPSPEWLIGVLAEPLDSAPVHVPTTAPPSRSFVGESRAGKWAATALDFECSKVRGTATGSRNHVLNTASFNVGTLVGGGRIDAGEARAKLLEAALACGLSKSEASKTIASGLRAGMEAETRSAPTRDREDWSPGAGRRTNGSASGGNGYAASGGGGGAWEPDGPSDALTSASEPKPGGADGGGGAKSAGGDPPAPALEPRYTTAQLFAELPPQRWLVPALQLGPGRPMLIAGYGASAKTLAVQALALALASGRKIWDHFEPAAVGRVLHIDYEQGFHATAKRYQRLALGHGIELGELGDRIRYVALPRVYLDKREHEDIFVRACEGVDLVIFDALRGAAPHTDENDSAFRGAIDLCTHASQMTNVTALLLHHAAKPKEGHKTDARTLARGSSAIYDASGCVLNVVARSGSPARLVTQVKMPAEAEGLPLEPFELMVEDVALDGASRAGVRVTWRVPEVVDALDAATSVFERDAALMIKSVRRHAGKSSNVIVSRCGLPRARALDVLKALADEGRLVVSAGRNRSKFFRVPDRPGEPARADDDYDDTTADGRHT